MTGPERANMASNDLTSYDEITSSCPASQIYPCALSPHSIALACSDADEAAQAQGELSTTMEPKPRYAPGFSRGMQFSRTMDLLPTRVCSRRLHCFVVDSEQTQKPL